jgi:hypothetical protein
VVYRGVAPLSEKKENSKDGSWNLLTPQPKCSIQTHILLSGSFVFRTILLVKWG